MEPRMNSGRPVRPQQTRQQAPTIPPVAQQQYRPQQPRRNKWLLLTVGAVIVLVFVGLAVWKFMGVGASAPRGDRYQAVFLDNGQVFFGKLKNTEGHYLRLDDAYYTKKQDLPADATEEQKAAVNNNVSLAKVGSEVYGPESTVQVRAEQVLFWQDLKSDSKVAKAIEDAQKE